MITLLSTAGIPLTIGFYAKYLVLDALVNQNMIIIAVIVVLFTVIGLYYYLRVIWFMFFETGFNSLIKVNGIYYLAVLSIIPFSIIAIFLFRICIQLSFLDTSLIINVSLRKIH